MTDCTETYSSLRKILIRKELGAEVSRNWCPLQEGERVETEHEIAGAGRCLERYLSASILLSQPSLPRPPYPAPRPLRTACEVLHVHWVEGLEGVD